jgi:methionyl-tRNA synthetase
MCKYADAGGDQCDGCGKLINAIELIEPKCKTCESNPIVKQSKHIFIDLAQMSGEVKEFVDK